MVYAATDTFDKAGMVSRLEHAVELFLNAAPKVGISQAEVDRTDVAWILDEAVMLRGRPPGDTD